MKSTVKNAYAKINLALDVIGKKSDGYHELDGVMHSIELCDIITVTKTSGSIKIISDIDLPEDNTIIKAARLYSDAAGIEIGAEIQVEKHIPSESGLGGASADAAAVLSSLCELFLPLENEQLYEFAKKVGADVPFCLHGGCARAGGIGEKLTDVTPQKLNILLVKNKKGISTKKLFDICDSYIQNETHTDRIDKLINACYEHRLDGICSNMFNSLESAAISLCPEIELTKRQLISCGALCAMMTGSGSCVYGIFNSAEAVADAYKQMQQYNYDYLKISKTI